VLLQLGEGGRCKANEEEVDWIGWWVWFFFGGSRETPGWVCGGVVGWVLGFGSRVLIVGGG